MDRTITRNSLEDKVFNSFWQDGLIDCFAGFSLLGTGIAWVTGNAALGGVLPAILIPIWPQVRRRVTSPRLGQVRFSSELNKRESRKLTVLGLFLGLTALAGIVGFLLTFARPEVATPRSWIAGVPSILVGVMSVGAARLWSLHRFYVYAGLLVFGGVAVVTFNAHPGWGFLVPGILVSIAGIALLIRFLRQNPVLEESS